MQDRQQKELSLSALEAQLKAQQAALAKLEQELQEQQHKVELETKVGVLEIWSRDGVVWVGLGRARLGWWVLGSMRRMLSCMRVSAQDRTFTARAASGHPCQSCMQTRRLLLGISAQSSPPPQHRVHSSQPVAHFHAARMPRISAQSLAISRQEASRLHNEARQAHAAAEEARAEAVAALARAEARDRRSKEAGEAAEAAGKTAAVQQAQLQAALAVRGEVKGGRGTPAA